MRNYFCNLTFLAIVAVAAFSGFGLSDYSNLIAQVKQTPAADWHMWAAQVIERSKTNSTPIPKSEFPAFVRRIPEKIPATNWQLDIQTNDAEPYVCLYSLGGFQSISLDVGSPSFTETNHPQSSYRVTAIDPGIYVWTSL